MSLNQGDHKKISFQVEVLSRLSKLRKNIFAIKKIKSVLQILVNLISDFNELRKICLKGKIIIFLVHVALKL